MGLDPSPVTHIEPCGCRYLLNERIGKFVLMTLCAEHEHSPIIVLDIQVETWPKAEPFKVAAGRWGLHDENGWEIWALKPYPGPEVGLPDIQSPLRFSTRAQAKAYAITRAHQVRVAKLAEEQGR